MLNQKNLCFLILLIFLLSPLISLIPVVEAAEQETDSENVLISKSAHSSVVNAERVRDGTVGVFNQAQLNAEACNSTCTDFTYAAVIVNATYLASVSLVDFSLDYETWGETNQLGEEDPYGLHIYAWIFHKFGNSTVTLQTSTTGYGNMQFTEIGEYAVRNDSTIEIWIVVSHESTSSLADEAGMRAHELNMNQGSPDDDSDGVANINDECPSTPSSQLDEVDDTGCASQETDADEDSVPDTEDICPETDSDLEVDSLGCADNQKDSDDDGVTDDQDSCPDTSLGAVVDSEGCADNQKDSDDDGVADNQDSCLDTSLGAVVDSEGCADNQKDSDDDGVTDDQDQCASTPNGESIDGNGCSASQKDSDDDGDGISDNVDQCTNTPPGENVDANGCSSSHTDSEGDGFADADDLCEGHDDSVDVDADGVPDGCDSLLHSDSDGVDDATDNSTANDDSTSTASNVPSTAVLAVGGVFIVSALIALILGIILLRGGNNQDLGMGSGTQRQRQQMLPPPLPPVHIKTMQIAVNQLEQQRIQAQQDASLLRQQLANSSSHTSTQMQSMQAEMQCLKDAAAQAEEEKSKLQAKLQEELVKAKSTTVVQNITYNIQDSAIAGDINATNLMKEQDD